MKYRLFEGGYEGFLDDRVPEEYKDIVVGKLPPEYLIKPISIVPIRERKLDKLIEMIEQGKSILQIKSELEKVK